MNRFVIRTAGALVAAVAACAGATPAQGAFVNGGFETVNFTGWQTSGRTGVIGTLGTAPNASPAPQGNFQAILESGVAATNPQGITGNPVPVGTLAPFVGLTVAQLNALNQPNPNPLGLSSVTEGSAIRQTITVSAGDVLTFDWRFLTNESTPDANFNDFAFVTITPAAGGNATLANTFFPTFIPASGGYNERTPLGTFTFTFPTSGSFAVAVGVADVGDTGVTSGLLVDNFQVAAIPEIDRGSAASALALVVGGVLVLTSRRRYRLA